MSVQHITSANYDALVLGSSKPVLLDFWATWCGPCKMIAPIVEEVAEEREDILVGKVNVDEEMELAIKFGVSSIPTLALIKNGVVSATSVGYCPKKEILELIDR